MDPNPIAAVGREPAMLIGGSWVTAQETRPVINPADESVIAEMPEGTEEDAGRALEAARAAQPDWARRSGVQRGAVVRAIAAAIRAESEELARLIVAEQGKTITEARGEVEGTAGFFSYFAGFERAQVGTMWASDEPGEQLWIKSVPYGVVAGIIPWNFPAALFARKVAPAIMAGNAIVIKPHEDTPLASLALARISEQAGVPAGVVNVVTGAGAVVGDALVRHPCTRLVTVTGSVRAGRAILAAAAQNITVVSLELGGKAPLIVMEDADLEAAVRNAVEARFWNCGQVCTCNERTYVQRGVYDEFVERFVAQAAELRLGDPMRDDVQMGPKVNRAELEKVDELVQGAVAAGASVVLGGGRPEGEEFEKGYWYAPTVLTDVSNDSDIVQKEVFGPVLPVLPFDDFDEGIRMANDSPYGLSSYLFTSDLDRAMRAVDDIEAGEVYINKIGPEQLQGFHTGYGLSGMGGDDGVYGYERYSRRKTIYLRHGGAAEPAPPSNLG